MTFKKKNKHGRKYKLNGQKKKRLPSLSSLEAKLDGIFSEWIRRSAADEGGTVECVTCGKLMHWKGDGAQAGHFIKRQHRSVRFDERNVHPQCVKCNSFLGGNEAEYGRFILERYGAAVHAELFQLKRQAKKFTRYELEELIGTYKARLEALNAI